jgi:ArsR family transcriptional regulator
MNTQDLAARARVLKALASPVRLRIVAELREAERCICELQPLFPHDKSTLSRHVAALRNAGIIRERREGVRIHLSLATPCVLTMLDCTMGVIRAEARHRSGLASRRKVA